LKRRAAVALGALVVLLGAPGAASAAPPVAPYVDMTLGGFNLQSASHATGVKAYSLGFVVADGGCKAAWGGVQPVSGAPFAGDISALRADGGEVIPSFGGQAGTELALACLSASALAAQYESVITTYHLTSIDFDVEAGSLGAPASIDRRSQAIKLLEHAHRKLQVSLTLPVLPTGLDPDGLAVVRSAIKHGARIDVVNLMTMDYGDGAAPHPAGRMGTYAIDAAKAVHNQLAKLYPHVHRTALWRMVGVTPMIGVNDTSDEVFQLADARQLIKFARGKHLGRLAFWAATRDHQCSGGAQSSAQDDCSSVLQTNWAFSRAFAAYKG
jgi:hypothetical protein